MAVTVNQHVTHLLEQLGGGVVNLGGFRAGGVAAPRQQNQPILEQRRRTVLMHTHHGPGRHGHRQSTVERGPELRR